MAKVSVVEAARAANAFRRDNWWRAIGPMTLIVVGATLSRLWQHSTGVTAALGALAGLVGAVGGLMAYGALYRLALADEHPDDPTFRPGPNGLQWRSLEWRLVGVGLLGVAIVAVACLVVALAYFAGGGHVPTALSPQPTPSALAILVGLIVICALAYIGLRLSLAMPATVDRGEIRFFRTWPLTQGAVLPILGADLLIAAVVLGFTLIALFGGTALGAIAGAAASFAAPPGSKLAAIANITGAGATLGTSVVHALVGLPLTVGVTAYIYKTLRDGAPAA